MRPERPPAGIFGLVGALTALGAYFGANTPAEHAGEAERLGYRPDFSRVVLANAPLGVAEKEALRAMADAGPEDGVSIAHQQALRAAGVTGNSTDLLNFLRWRTLRVGLPLRQIIPDENIGAIPLAAAQAAEGLQLLIGYAADAQKLTPETFAAFDDTADLKAAQAALSAALGNVELMLKMLAVAE